MKPLPDMEKKLGKKKPRRLNNNTNNNMKIWNDRKPECTR
jgi:hypothetical protein